MSLDVHLLTQHTKGSCCSVISFMCLIPSVTNGFIPMSSDPDQHYHFVYSCTIISSTDGLMLPINQLFFTIIQKMEREIIFVFSFFLVCFGNYCLGKMMRDEVAGSKVYSFNMIISTTPGHLREGLDQFIHHQ